MPPIKINKANVTKLTFNGKPTDYFDVELKGFGVRVGQETKTFFVRKFKAGKPIRVTIGRLGAWTPDLAREEAKRLLQQVDQGINPAEEARKAKDASKPLRDVIADYLKHRKLKPATRRNYSFHRDLYLTPWLERPMAGISRADVLDLHRKLTAEIGEATANGALIFFGSLWNYAFAHMEQPPASPTAALTAAKAWHKAKRRKDRLAPRDFPQFAEALKFLRHTRRDAMLLAWHTGMRAENIERLSWQGVDLKARTLLVPDTKNGEDLYLPLSEPIHAMLERRKELDDGSPYVFKGQGKSGMMRMEAEVIHRIGFPDLTVHGLRRTFRSLCESLHFPQATIKALMGHSLMTDITDSYLEMPVEILRPYSERVSAEILRLSGATPEGPSA